MEWRHRPVGLSVPEVYIIHSISLALRPDLCPEFGQRETPSLLGRLGNTALMNFWVVKGYLLERRDTDLE